MRDAFCRLGRRGRCCQHLSPTLKNVWADTLSLNREQREEHFQQFLPAQKEIADKDGGAREKRYQAELEHRCHMDEVYEGIIKRRLALEEKARRQELWELK